MGQGAAGGRVGSGGQVGSGNLNRKQKPEGATGHALVQKSTVADICIYIYIYMTP